MTSKLNSLHSTLALLSTRRSGKVSEIVAPGLDGDDLRDILTIATRVPDHGKLAPWRFIVVEQDRRVEFAELLRRAYRADNAPAGHLGAIDRFAQQAPNLVVVLSLPDPISRIPHWEQELSAGAACMALLYAVHAKGFVGAWLTGWAAYSPIVRAGLGFPDSKIAGFIFMGSPANDLTERSRPDLDSVASVWRG